MTVQLQAGDLIADRYRSEEFLDEGGISKVWLGTDDVTGRRIVIKFPNYDSGNSPQIVKQSIEQEMEVLQKIQDAGGHPNLMTLIDRVEHDGNPVMVVGYVTGETMHSLVKRQNGFANPEDIRSVGVKLCQAMSFLHENEIMYRDLKPDNVMVKSDMTPVLIDFNTAKGFEPSAGDDASGGTVIPNPTYKPPELNNDPELVGFRQGPWSDVYSLGKVLMFMFSASAARGDGIDPRDFPGTRSVPEYFAEIIERATAAHKNDRYRNATVLARVLQNRDPTPPERASIKHLQSGNLYEVYPGDTVGRLTDTGPQASISLPDPDNHISAVQVQFDNTNDDTWLLKDRSLNGTWVKRGQNWHRIISERGRGKLAGTDQAPANLEDVPSTMAVQPGDRIALVHPSYDVWLEFHG